MRIPILALILIALSGCTGMPLRDVPGARPVTAVSNGSCLAMSGGGIRSGAVSLGALQGLFALDKLAPFELISTVSGGGYPVYGLLDRMLRDEIALRTLLREQGKYIADVDRQAVFIGRNAVSPVLVLEPTLGVALSWLTRAYGSAQPTYILNIHRTFTGESLPMFGHPMLQSAKDIRQHGFPLPIFGASVSIGAGQPLDGYRYGFDDFFELSPLSSGAPSVGYFENFGRQITLGQAVAMSAAAIDTPQGEIQLPQIVKALNFGLGGNFYVEGKDGKIVHFYLADGGFIENLGLLPLLRHGCKQILAFDNSDDNARPFDAWINFSRRLSDEEKGWKVINDLRAATGDLPPVAPEARWELPHHIWDAQLGHENGNRVHIRVVKLGMSRQTLEIYPPSVRKFAEKNWRGKDPGCKGSGLGQRCSFPLESTVRQSFTTEEFRAYRRLGKWLAKLAIDTSPPTFESI